MALATLYSPVYSTARRSWTEGRRQYLHGCQNGSKHRLKLLPSEPFLRNRSVCPDEEKVVSRCQTLPVFWDNQAHAVNGSSARDTRYALPHSNSIARTPPRVFWFCPQADFAPSGSRAQGPAGRKRRGAGRRRWGWTRAKGLCLAYTQPSGLCSDAMLPQSRFSLVSGGYQWSSERCLR